MNSNSDNRKKIIGKKIKTARISANIIQKQLAEKIGVERSSISKYESGDSLPDIFNLSEMCAVLNISASELLK